MIKPLKIDTISLSDFGIKESDGWLTYEFFEFEYEIIVSK